MWILEYIIEPNHVKENVIIKTKKETYDLKFILLTQGLELSMREDGSLNATTGDGNIVYKILAANMYDSAGAMSFDVQYDLKRLEEFKYEFTINADPEWINIEERVFPVVIDPTVTVPYSTSNCEIVRIESNNTDIPEKVTGI